MRSGRCRKSGMKGFTLIELLVVVAIIALLISILLPSMSQARRQAQLVASMSNLRQIALGNASYSEDNAGYLPYARNTETGTWGNLWSEAAWGVKKADLWFYTLFDTKTVPDERVFVPAGDPYGQQYDFESRFDGIGGTGAVRTNTQAFACGYGMNYGLRHWEGHRRAEDFGRPPLQAPYGRLFNVTRYGPTRPNETILMSEVGPDDELPVMPLFGSADPMQVGRPWRDGGRLLWDDGNRSWYPGPTWLTPRYGGRIPMTAMDGSVRAVNSARVLRTGPIVRRNQCFGRAVVGGQTTFVCYLCRESTPHYDFSDQKLWWWTGHPGEIKY